MISPLAASLSICFFPGARGQGQHPRLKSAVPNNGIQIWFPGFVDENGSAKSSSGGAYYAPFQPIIFVAADFKLSDFDGIPTWHNKCSYRDTLSFKGGSYHEQQKNRNCRSCNPLNFVALCLSICRDKNAGSYPCSRHRDQLPEVIKTLRQNIYHSQQELVAVLIRNLGPLPPVSLKQAAIFIDVFWFQVGILVLIT